MNGHGFHNAFQIFNLSKMSQQRPFYKSYLHVMRWTTVKRAQILTRTHCDVTPQRFILRNRPSMRQLDSPIVFLCAFSRNGKN